MLPKRRLLVVLLACTLGLLYSWSLITTNDVFKPSSSASFKKASLIGGFDSSSVIHPSSSVIRLDSKEKQSDKVPLVQTLFRGDVLARVKPVLGETTGEFPVENKFSRNTHENSETSIIGRGSDGQGQERSNPLKIPYKLVHIDLKGAPPRLSYLKSLFKTISETGANGILLEYEDMFPFNGFLGVAAHKFHYSKEEIQDLISTALQYNLEVIPLIQTFGHLEFVLKLEEFRSLRELNEFPQEVCPSNEKAWIVVMNIIDQILSFNYGNTSSSSSIGHHHYKRGSQYPNYIHIGCDEVFHIGECEKCKDKSGKDLFLNHVIRVAKYIKDKYRVTSIIWDDMLRKFYVEDLIKSEIGLHVELMIWDYTEDVDRLLSPYLWPMYAQVFPNIWIASAFKGAFGETLHKVDIQRHALNQLSWLRVLSRESSRIRNLRGIALTGWSRYDHFSVLCELLPVAVPSLILALQIWVKQDYQEALGEMFKLLQCDEMMFAKLDQCQWNGVDLSNSMNTLEFYQSATASLIQSQRTDKGWLTYYNLQHNYSSPWRLIEPIQQSSQYLSSIKGFESSVRIILRKYYEDYVVNEWIEEKIGSLVNQLQSLFDDARSLEARRVWQRRPIT